MEWKEYFKCILKGLIGALSVTILLIGVLSLIMSFVEISSSIFSGLYVAITSISLVIGTIIAAKIYGKKGWLIGLAVGVTFYIALYLIGIIFGEGAALNFFDIIRFILCIVVGTLSGMLGINLGSD